MATFGSDRLSKHCQVSGAIVRNMAGRRKLDCLGSPPRHEFN
jgi:hypothetical protein